MIFNKRYIFNLVLPLFVQIGSCQLTETKKIITTRIIKADSIITSTSTFFKTVTNSRILPTTITPINKNGTTYINETLSDPISNGNRVDNSTLGYNNTVELNENDNTIDLDEIEYEKAINWTSGYGTHYGPFPSSPHFSEVGYQPQDVGVGCSDGRPGGDPRWKNILSQGVHPSPNLVGHQHTVWPIAYTVAVSLAVWNKEDVCWKTIKIRNKKKPKFMIEAYIVDFCPIGYCQWKDKYLARNVDVYGEKAWFALGASGDESKLEVEIEWPEGVVPHDAIKLSAGFSRIGKNLMTIVAPLISIFFVLNIF